MHISKEKAINLIEHNDKVCHYADERYENVVYATTQKICEVVAKMPAADVQPVKRGKWIEIAGYGGWSNSEFKCPECGITEYKPTNFCPNCGAELRGIDNG